MSRMIRLSAVVVSAPLLFWSAPASAVLISSYDFDGNLADTLGIGPSMTSLGGSLATAGRYTFDRDQGLNLTGALADKSDYTIEMKFQMTSDPGFWKKLVDYNNLTSDTGLYLAGDRLAFYDTTEEGPTPFPLGTDAIVTISRNGDTGLVSAELNGILQWTFVDDGSEFDGVVAIPGTNVLNFFKDDFVTGQSETFAGSVDYIRIFDNNPADFVWSGTCGGGNWHDGCADSNWNDIGGEPATFPPGDAAAGDETATIAGAAVTISDRAVTLKSLSATGSLNIHAPLSLAENSSIQNLTLNSSLHSDGQLTLTGDSVWQSGAVSGDAANVASGASGLTVGPGAGLTIQGGDKTLGTNLTVQNTGRATQADGTLTIAPGATLRTDAGGTYAIAAGGIAASGKIVNQGLFTKVLPPSGAAPPVTVGADFDNDGGTIDVRSGVLAIDGRLVHRGGTWVVNETGTLALSNLLIDGPLGVSGGGDVVLAGGNPIVNTGATANFDLDPTGGLKIDGPSLTLLGTLNNSGQATYLSGTLIGGEMVGDVVEGGFVNQVGAHLEISGGVAEKKIAGIFRNQGPINMDEGAVLTFDRGTLLNSDRFDASDGAEFAQTPNGPSAFENAGGTFTAKGTVVFNSLPLNVSNGGTVRVDPGARLVLLSEGAHSGSGTFDVAGDLAFNAVLGEQTFDGDFTFSGPGTVVVAGGNQLSIIGGNVTSNVTNFVFREFAGINAVGGAFVNKGIAKFGTDSRGASVISGGSFTETGSTNGFVNEGGVVIIGESASGFVLRIDDGAFRNVGTGATTGRVNQFGSVLLEGSVILNEAGGVWNLAALEPGSSIFIASGSSLEAFVNRGGTVNKLGPGTANIATPFSLLSGRVFVDQGSLALFGGGNSKGTGNFDVAEGANISFKGSGIFYDFDGEYQAIGRGDLVVDPGANFLVRNSFVVDLTGPGKALFRGTSAGGFSGGLLTNKGNAEWQARFMGKFLNDTGATLAITGTGEKEILGRFENKGTVEHALDAPVKLDVTQEGEARIVNHGTYNLRGTLIGNGANHLIENRLGATFRVAEEGVTRSFGGVFDNQGTVEAAPGSTLILLGQVPQLDSSVGTDVLRGKWVAEGDGRIQIGFDNTKIDVNSGVIVMRDDGRITNLPDANAGDVGLDFTNNGTYELRGATIFRTPGGFETNGALRVDAASTLDVGGQFEMNSGTTTIDGVLFADSIDLDGGTFGGAGIVNTPTMNNLAADLSPGSSPGILTIEGNYVQGPLGNLLIEIGGTTPGLEHDVLVVTGDAFIDGFLQLDFLDGFVVPDALDVFTFLDVGGALSGGFAGVSFTGLPPGSLFDLMFDTTTGQVAIAGVVATVPEPGTIFIFVFGLVALGAVGRPRGPLGAVSKKGRAARQSE